MKVGRRRLPTWPFVAVAAATLQTLSVFVASLTTYVVVTRYPPCSPLQECLGSLLPAHPYVWLGVGLYIAGAALMGVAAFLVRRLPRQPHTEAATA